MNYQWISLELFISIILLCNVTFSFQQDQPCTLPDGLQRSKCIRLHHCDSFQSKLREYGINPPLELIQNINAHVCDGGRYVCCPDNSFLPQRTTEIEDFVFPSHPDIPVTKADFDSLKNHPNLNLINHKSCGSSSSKRILGGEDAELFEIPWAALLGFHSRLDGTISWNCGGTLISDRFVLTAAHCLTSELIVVRLGEHTISTQIDCDAEKTCSEPVQDITIEKRIKHPKFDRRDRINDIALLKLETAADISKSNVRTVCMPTLKSTDLDNKQIVGNHFTIFGWGIFEENNRTADVLQKALVPNVKYEECVQRYKDIEDYTIYPSYLCAGGQSNKTDTCRGDSGGGITAISMFVYPKVTIYGVISGGYKCSNPNTTLPGIYTDVRYYLNWILDNMN